MKPIQVSTTPDVSDDDEDDEDDAKKKDDVKWLVKNQKDLNDKWTHRESLFVTLNRYLYTQILTSLREDYSEEFPKFIDLHDKLHGAFFDPVGVGRATELVCKKIVKVFFTYRQQLIDENQLFITTTAVPTLLFELDTKALLESIRSRDADAKREYDEQSGNNDDDDNELEPYESSESFLWAHFRNVCKCLIEILKDDPTTTLKHLTAKERDDIMKLKENSDLLKITLASMKSARDAAAIVKQNNNNNSAPSVHSQVEAEQELGQVLEPVDSDSETEKKTKPVKMEKKAKTAKPTTMLDQKQRVPSGITNKNQQPTNTKMEKQQPQGKEKLDQPQRMEKQHPHPDQRPGQNQNLNSKQNQNPQAKQNQANQNPTMSHKQKPKVQLPTRQNNQNQNKNRNRESTTTKKKLQKSYDDDNDDDADEEDESGDEGMDAEIMQNTVRNLFQSEGIKELFAETTRASQDEQTLKPQDMTPEQLKSFTDGQKNKYQGIMGKLAGGLFDLTESAGGRKKNKKTTSASDRQATISRYEHVLSRMCKLDFAVHENPDHLIEDEQNEELERQALEDGENLQKTDILTHFHEELMEFVFLISESRAKPGMEQYIAAPKNSKERLRWKNYVTMFQFCNDLIDAIDKDGLTEFYLNELVRVHECKPLRKAFKKKDPSLFLGCCGKKDKERAEVKVIDEVTKQEVIKVYSNKLFLILWKTSPKLADTLYKIQVDKLYRSYARYPDNLKLVLSKLRKVMQFVGILSHFQTGSSMEGIRPILTAVMAVNKLTPEKQNDPNFISNIMKSIISKFGTKRTIDQMHATSENIVKSGEIMRPFQMFSQMMSSDTAESLGLDDPDDSDDEETAKKDSKEDTSGKTDNEAKMPGGININKLKGLFGTLLGKKKGTASNSDGLSPNGVSANGANVANSGNGSAKEDDTANVLSNFFDTLSKHTKPQKEDTSKKSDAQKNEQKPIDEKSNSVRKPDVPLIKAINNKSNSIRKPSVPVQKELSTDDDGDADDEVVSTLPPTLVKKKPVKADTARKPSQKSGPVRKNTNANVDPQKSNATANVATSQKPIKTNLMGNATTKPIKTNLMDNATKSPDPVRRTQKQTK